MAESMFFGRRRRLVALATMSRLPTMHNIRPFVEAGGLMAYGPSPPDLRRRAAVFVDKILKGAKAADWPVEQPTKFELVINLKTAQAPGITIPPSLRLLAEEVIHRVHPNNWPPKSPDIGKSVFFAGYPTENS
jgi:putative ABC transport system substrate-binding protein